MAAHRSFQRSTQSAIVVVMWLAGITAVLWPAETATGRAGAPGWKIGWFLFAAIGSVAVIRLAASRITISPIGVTIHNTFSTTKLTWPEISGFDVGPSFPTARAIRVRRVDGSAVGCTGLPVDRRGVPADQVSAAVLMELNEALTAAKPTTG